MQDRLPLLPRGFGRNGPLLILLAAMLVGCRNPDDGPRPRIRPLTPAPAPAEQKPGEQISNPTSPTSTAVHREFETALPR